MVQRKIMENNPEISIIIPVYNEKNTIESLLKKVLYVELKKEIIIVDDGSTDSTKQYLKSLNHKNIKVFFHDKNSGKGSAIRTAIKHISSQTAIIQDADLEYEPTQIPQLLELLKETNSDAVYGSRFLKNPNSPPNKGYKLSYSAGNKFLTFLINILCKSNFTDSYTCYKLLRKRIWQELNLESNGFEIEAEISVKIALRKYKILELPITYQARSRSEGKKINWKDGIKGIKTIFKLWFKEIFFKP